MKLIKSIFCIILISGFFNSTTAQIKKPATNDSAVQIGIQVPTIDAGDRPFESDKSDIQSQFPGGDSMWLIFVKQNFNYPTRCLEEGISGSAQLKFIVDLRGRISSIMVLEENNSCPEFAVEAIRLLKTSPPWIPAQIHGKFVKSYRLVTIKINPEN